MKGRLWIIHSPEIFRGRVPPRPATALTVGLPINEVHNLLLYTAPQSSKANLRTRLTIVLCRSV